MEYLPSKKVILASFFVLALLVLALLLPNEKSYTGQKFSRESLEGFGLEKIAVEDRDGDGLPDWEENLWQTDPLNPDTDGDGALDGEEVNGGRDPNIPGPDDLLPENKTRAGILGANEENLTLTEKFGREFFVGYANLKTNERFEGNQTELLYNLLEQNALEVDLPETYTISDVKSVNSNNTVIKDYTESLVSNLELGAEVNEVAVIAEILETRSKESVSRLQEVIDINKRILKKNFEMPAPEGLETLHLEILNSHNGVIQAMENISKINEDPLVAVVGIGQYAQATEVFQEAFEALGEYLLSKKISF